MMKRRERRLLSFLSARAQRFLVTARRMLDPSAELDEQAERTAADIAVAERLAASAGDLGAGMAKIAQLRGYLPSTAEGTTLAPEAQRVLGRLWDRAPEKELAAIKAVIEADLGKPLAELFASFAEKPLAAASLGQVHAATLRDDTPRPKEPGAPFSELAVKVQYPGAAEALRDDLEARRVLEELVGAGLGGAVDEAALAALRSQLLAELDYRAEAANLLRMRRAFGREAAVVIPRVVPALSSARVLSMELLRGRTLPSLFAGGAAAERTRVASTILRFSLRGPLRHGLVNADPNPGNYLVLSGEAAPRPATDADREPPPPLATVGFIDFGCVTELSEKVRAADRSLFLALIQRDGEGLRHAAYRAGLVPSPKAFDTKIYRRWERAFAEPFLSRTPFRLETGYAKELFELHTTLVHDGKLALPADALLLWRQRLGVLSVLANLRPELPARRLLADVLEEVESDELGDGYGDGPKRLPLYQRYQ